MPLHALIVEDDFDLAPILEMKLKGLGHEATIARNQEEAHRLLDTEHFDLALLDLKLPVNDEDADPDLEVGFDILARIVEPEGPPFPVYVMTAYGDGVSTAVRAMKGGAEEFLVKSQGLDERIEGIVKAVLSGACRTIGRSPRRAKEHCLIFDELSVYVDGIKFQGGIVGILRLLAARAYEGAGLPSDEKRADDELTSYRIANLLGKTQEAVRAIVTRFRKRLSTEMHERGRTVRDDEIIVSAHTWQGYSLNPAVVLGQFSPGDRISA